VAQEASSTVVIAFLFDGEQHSCALTLQASPSCKERGHTQLPGLQEWHYITLSNIRERHSGYDAAKYYRKQ
jgi:hypothetical protein